MIEQTRTWVFGSPRVQRVAVTTIKRAVASRWYIGVLATSFTPVACARGRKHLVHTSRFFARQLKHLRAGYRRQEGTDVNSLFGIVRRTELAYAGWLIRVPRETSRSILPDEAPITPRSLRNARDSPCRLDLYPNKRFNSRCSTRRKGTRLFICPLEPARA